MSSKQIEDGVVDAVLIPSEIRDIPVPKVLEKRAPSIVANIAAAVVDLPAVVAHCRDTVPAEINEENFSDEMVKTAKEGRKMAMAVQNALESAHKEEKSAFLEAGRYIDQSKKALQTKIDSIKSDYDRVINFEKEQHQKKVDVLFKERAEALAEIGFEPVAGLGSMEEQIWDAFLLGKRAEAMKIAEAQLAEKKRIEDAEKEAAAARAEADAARIETQKIQEVYGRRMRDLIRVELQQLPENLGTMPETEYLGILETAAKAKVQRDAEAAQRAEIEKQAEAARLVEAQRIEFERQMESNRQNEVHTKRLLQLKNTYANYSDPMFLGSLTDEEFGHILLRAQTNAEFSRRQSVLIAAGFAYSKPANGYVKTDEVYLIADFQVHTLEQFKDKLNQIENSIEIKTRLAEKEAENARIAAGNDTPLFLEIISKIDNILEIKRIFAQQENAVLYSTIFEQLVKIKNQINGRIN